MSDVRELIVFVFSLVLVDTGSSGESSDLIRVRKCEPIGVEICHDLGYNYTGFPNLVGHESQSDADLQLRTFTPLIQYGCSPYLRFFLCTVYAPMCTDKVPDVIGPCRSVCEKVRGRCEPVLRKFGFPWPVHLNCSKFHPFNGHQHMCMEGPRLNGSVDDPVGERDPGVPAPTKSVPIAHQSVAISPGSRSRRCHNKFIFSNRSRACLLRCDQNLWYAQKDKKIMDDWLAVWSTIGLLSTAFIASTFFVDVTRFSSVERHVVFMTSCFGMCSVAYVVRVIAGRDVISCVAVDPPRDQSSVLPRNGLASTDCTVLFVLVYYFAMAGTIWWVVLTLTWLFVAGLRWTVESTRRLGTYFHMVAWTVPAIQVVVILIRKDIEPSEFSGMCHVTSSYPQAVAGFLLAPMVTCLVVGTAFLCGGLIGHCQAKSAQHKCEHNHQRSVKDIAWQNSADRDAVCSIATFALVCVFPLLGTTNCVLVNYVGVRRSQLDQDIVGSSSDPRVEARTDHQSVAVYLTEVVLSVLISIFAAIRAGLSTRTRRAWRDFFGRRFGKGTKVDGRFPQVRLPPSGSGGGCGCSGGGVQNGCRVQPESGVQLGQQQRGLIDARKCNSCSACTCGSQKIHSGSRISHSQTRSIQYIL